jgi:hypothetical protein
VPQPHRRSNGKSEVAKISAGGAIIVAAISGVFGLGASIVQYAVTKPATESKIAGFFDRNLPVGTILASVLTPRDFARVAGDSGDFDPRTSAWVPADSRGVSGSDYARRVSTVVPDLRGMFLRGLNHSDTNQVRSDGNQDPDGAGRTAGHYQPDGFKQHSHTYDRSYYPGAGKSGGGPPDVHAAHQPQETGPAGGTAQETRPKNVAVHYYIKIN